MKFNYSGSTQTINKYTHNLMPDGGKCYEKKAVKENDDVGNW